MGFMKDIKKLSDQSNALQKKYPVKDSLANAQASMANANAMIANMAQASAAATQAMTNGVDATATITAARQTGTQMNFNPVIELDLLVMMPSGVPMPVTRQETVAQLHLARCQVGGNLRVKVEPNNPNSLWIDWNTPA